jgi:hypothetical protein
MGPLVTDDMFETATICEGEFTIKCDAGTPAIVTCVASRKLVPLIVTKVLPVVEPLVGENEVIVGVPPAPVTDMTPLVVTDIDFPSGITPPMKEVVAVDSPIVPDVVIVPPVNPVPAVIEVTVPLEVAGPTRTQFVPSYTFNTLLVVSNHNSPEIGFGGAIGDGIAPPTVLKVAPLKTFNVLLREFHHNCPSIGD